ncbi:acetylglutamate kinase [Ferrimonas marina]|uniref:Acetylglutamate kinase n=1 Tax=Ferrimonas marina TaxID=299255 RepID=A0A1M5XH08_9GAMM|nr:acetylglutamate kinase [Ferrimonas marina]SHH99117.1 N-acetylglutamate kinase [Ferrimonas marina]
MKTMVIKVGGALLACEQGIERLFDTLLGLKQGGWQLVLVHGGGVVVEQQLSANGFVSEKLDGLRITPAAQIPVVAGALAGTANTALVAAAAKAGLVPVGLSLADGEMVKAQVLNESLGCVGEVVAKDATLPKTLLQAGMLPIISSIAVDECGQLLNVNADQAATVICQLLGAELTLLSDVSGVLDGKGELIPQLDQAECDKQVALGVIEGGMKVKVEAALAAAKTINNSVRIASWRYPEQLAALLDGQPVGTAVQP